MEVRYVPSSQIPPIGSNKTYESDTTSPSTTSTTDSISTTTPTTEVDAWQETLFGYLASILHIRRAKLNAMDKQAFRAYWYGHKQVYKKTTKREEQ